MKSDNPIVVDVRENAVVFFDLNTLKRTVIHFVDKDGGTLNSQGFLLAMLDRAAHKPKKFKLDNAIWAGRAFVHRVADTLSEGDLGMVIDLLVGIGALAERARCAGIQVVVDEADAVTDDVAKALDGSVRAVKFDIAPVEDLVRPLAGDEEDDEEGEEEED